MVPIILTTGTFNIVHAGHVELFDFCKGLGTLYVGVNGDRYLKDKYRDKAISLEHRVKVLNSIKQINKVLVFEEQTPIELIKRTRPNIYVKGPDYLGVKIPELKILKNLNIEFIIPEADKILSTSHIISLEKYH